MSAVEKAEKIAGDFPARLVRERERAGLTRAELAERCECSPARVYEWETGVSLPGWRYVLILSLSLGITPDTFAEKSK